MNNNISYLPPWDYDMPRTRQDAENILNSNLQYRLITQNDLEQEITINIVISSTNLGRSLMILGYSFDDESYFYMNGPETEPEVEP